MTRAVLLLVVAAVLGAVTVWDVLRRIPAHWRNYRAVRL